MQVPRVRTSLTPAQMAPVFARAYEALTGKLPTRALAEIGLAIVGLENGQGKSIYDHNWGNIMWTGAGDYYQTKRIPGQPYRWRAEPNHDAGARHWWGLILRKYSPVIEAALRGDARGAARAIHEGGYFVPTINPNWSAEKKRSEDARQRRAYETGVINIARQYQDQGLFSSLAAGAASDAGKLGGLLFLAAAAVLFAWGWRKKKRT